MKKVFAVLLLVCLAPCVALLSGCSEDNHQVSEEFEAEQRKEAEEALDFTFEYFDPADIVDKLVDQCGRGEFLSIALDRTADDVYIVAEMLENVFGYDRFSGEIIEYAVEYYGDDVVDAVVAEYGVEYITENYS